MMGQVRYLVDPGSGHEIMSALVAEPDATSDATWLEISVYDALALMVNPDTHSIATAEVNPRTGVFFVPDVLIPGTGVLALVVAPTPSSGRTEVLETATVLEAALGTDLIGVSSYVVTAAQDLAWTASVGSASLAAAGCATTDTLASCGAWLPVFGYSDSATGRLVPLEGVRLLRGGAPAPYAKLLLFDDAREGFFAPVDSASAHTTSAGLLAGLGLGLSWSSGACVDLDPDSECEASALTWVDQMGGSLPGTFTVQLLAPSSP
jgi:hypothetical protein